MKQCSILVVDDSNTNIVLLEAILENKGYLIHSALNGQEAFESIEKQMPDLILLDLLMPKLSGYEFLQQLRLDERTKCTPVIVISALTDEDNVNRIKGLGALDFIEKPINIQRLIERVDHVLGQQVS
jgi:CheY-like chemotaxis protein